MNQPGPKKVSLPGDIHNELFVLALVASRARNRAPFVWVVSRFTRMLGSAEDSVGLPAGTEGLEEWLAWIADPQASMLEVVSRLQDAGALLVTGPAKKPTHLSLSRRAAGRYLLRKVVSRLMKGARSPAQTVERLTKIINEASGLAMSERTLWRWVRGEVAPDPETLARVAVAIYRRDGAEVALAYTIGFYRMFLLIISKLGAAGLTEGELERATTWLIAAAQLHSQVAKALVESSTDPKAYARHFKFLEEVQANYRTSAVSMEVREAK